MCSTLSAVICNCDNPPTLDGGASSVFRALPNLNCLLVVPRGTESSYANKGYTSTYFKAGIYENAYLRADDQTMTYGSDAPAFTYTRYSIEPMAKAPNIICYNGSINHVGPTTPVGTYPLFINNKSEIFESGYVTFEEGNVTVTKAPLTISAKSYTIKQGDPLPTFEATYSGFKNDETASVLTTQPTFSCSATSASAPGTYDITVSGATASNYTITYAKGTLTIEAPANPNITFADANVKALCVANWDTNGDGELSEAEAAAVTDLSAVFQSKSTITSFNELNYFTGLTSIEDYAFSGCTGLTSITIPNSVTQLGYWSFNECTSLESITFPSSLKILGQSSFRACESLTSITIPSNVTTVGSCPFEGCYNLTSIIVDPNNNVYDSRNNCNAIIHTASNELISGCKNTIIPNDVTRLGGNAFAGIKGVSIDIPESVTEIDGGAFAFLESSINTVVCRAATPPTLLIPGDVFCGTDISNATLMVPASSIDAYRTADEWKDFGTITSLSPVVTANSYEREYGDENPLLEWTVEGATLDGTPEISCAATETSAPGNYEIVITKGTETNADVTYVNGTLTVTKAPLTITAKSYTIKKGDALPTLELDYEGFKNGETVADLTTPPTVSCAATDSNTPGSYDITVSGATSSNYSITEVGGALNIREKEGMADDGNGIYMPWGQNSPWQMTYVYQSQDTGTPPDADWYKTTFDDSGWGLMTGPVDRASSPHFGLGSFFDVPDEGSALYLRRTFDIDATEYTNMPDPLIMKFTVDDRVDVYLNDKLLGTNQYSDGTCNFEYTLTFAKSDLVTGTNVLALYYHDESGEAYLDYSLMTAEPSNISPFTDTQGITYELDGTQTAWTVTGMNWNESQTSIDIPGTLFGLPVTTVNEWVFSGHEYITSITLNEGLTTINGWAFYDTGITSLNIPSSVTEIITDHDISGYGQPANPFGSCNNLATITVDANNTVYSSPTGSNAIIETATNKLVVGCMGTDMAKLPNVTEIGYAAFHDLAGLTEFTIPSNITTIGEGAFSGCSNLSAVTVEATTPINISGMSYPPFDGTKKDKLYVPVGSKAAYQAADGWNEFKYIWEIGETEVYPDEGYAYFDASTGTLTFVYDDQYISRTGVSVFFLDEPNGEPQWYYDGTNWSVTDVVIDPSFASAQPTSTHSWFREMPLNSLTGLENLNTSQVTTMNAMFYGNGSITSLDLSNFDVTNVTDMNYMFYNCTGLTSLTLPVGMDQLIGYSSPCEGVGQWGSTPCLLVVPTGFDFNGVDISQIPFYWAGGYFTISWDAYAELDASGKLTFYFDDQRANRTGTTYNIDGSYTGSGATSVVIDKSFANYAPTSTAQWFKGMSTLTSITGLDNITTWNVSDMTEMFSGCSGLETLDMSNFDVSSTGGNTSLMFDGCSGLKELSVSESMAYLASDACNGVGSTTDPCALSVPEEFDFQGVSTTGDSFQWMSGTFKVVTETGITIGSEGMATYCSPRSLDFTGMSNLQAYIIVGYDWQKMKVYAMHVNEVPAGTGIYLIGDPGTYQVKMSERSTCFVNMLVGTNVSTTIPSVDGDFTNLTFTIDGGTPGFRPASEGEAVDAHRAYLQIPNEYFNGQSVGINSERVGDINGDGSISVADVMQLVDIILLK